ncbi:GNAT family N-acetyltransferase [Nocardioides alcanivorans]|uniref:GNAT family N-acetyltransferase n=1 Tax=Nocardioides alcanivorans TaxID=2897352 RepID=UPI001F224DBF|nr:GNAT family N-acetyltransferase [Nocardioides alcanivorans]
MSTEPTGELPLTPLRTTRLVLPLITPAQAADLRAGVRHPSFAEGFPREDDLDACSMIKELTPWGSRLIVRGVDGLVCGSIGFYGPPTAVDGIAEVEVGYGLVPDARGRGVATEALSAVCDAADRVGVRVRASVVPDNAASLRVLAKSGFTQLRGSNEDGHLVMVRPGGVG